MLFAYAEMSFDDVVRNWEAFGCKWGLVLRGFEFDYHLEHSDVP